MGYRAPRTRDIRAERDFEDIELLEAVDELGFDVHIPPMRGRHLRTDFDLVGYSGKGRKPRKARRNTSSAALKMWRASMRALHGPDWWKDESLKASKPRIGDTTPVWTGGLFDDDEPTPAKKTSTRKPRKPRATSKSTKAAASAKAPKSTKTAAGIVKTRAFKSIPGHSGAQAFHFEPVWEAEHVPAGQGPGYLSMFDGLYVPFDGKLTKAKIMAAAKTSLQEIGGDDLRFIESVDASKERIKGLPVWYIGTGS